MNAHLTPERAEALALGQGTAEDAAHAEACLDCARELSCARAEVALFRRRRTRGETVRWEDIARRLPAQNVVPLRPRRLGRFAVAVTAALSAAAVLLLVVQRPASLGPPGEAEGDPRALAALDRAEGEVQRAARVMEAEYATARGRLEPAEARKLDAALQKARAQLALPAAAADVQTRLRVLDGYSDYVRSLRAVVASASARD